MKRNLILLCFCLFCVTLAGCSSEEPAASAAPKGQEKFDVSKGAEGQPATDLATTKSD